VGIQASFIQELMLNPQKFKSMKRQITVEEVTVWGED
jgi:hypothetical protein